MTCLLVDSLPQPNSIRFQKMLGSEPHDDTALVVVIVLVVVQCCTLLQACMRMPFPLCRNAVQSFTFQVACRQIQSCTFSIARDYLVSPTLENEYFVDIWLLMLRTTNVAIVILFLRSHVFLYLVSFRGLTTPDLPSSSSSVASRIVLQCSHQADKLFGRIIADVLGAQRGPALHIEGVNARRLVIDTIVMLLPIIPASDSDTLQLACQVRCCTSSFRHILICFRHILI